MTLLGLGFHQWLRKLFLSVAAAGVAFLLYVLFTDPRWNTIFAALIVLSFGFVGANEELTKIRKITGKSNSVDSTNQSDQTQEISTSASNAYVANANKRKMFFFIAPISLFVSISGTAVFLLVLSLLLPGMKKPEADFSAFWTAFFLICLPIFVIQLNNYSSYFRSKPTLVINASGLDFAWYGLITWDRISSIELLQQHTSQLGELNKLILNVESPELYWNQVPWVRLKRYKKGTAVGILEIDLFMLNETSEEIYSAAVRFRSLHSINK